KKLRQWSTWANQVIPDLIDPYLELLRSTCNLAQMCQAAPVPCACGGRGGTKALNVLCVDYNSEFELSVCACRPAALQLLRRGFFPCAPIAPSLAVDIRMLEFVKTLFVRMPPNATAWCDALESFLDGRGYKLDTRDSMRRRFSNALLWYGSLVNATKSVVTTYLEESRVTL
ncbi:hypothetical protein PLICRDRAFT_80582, partial [Plicaturopsis crispa FD-325 SS-3]